jgi:5-formyltetrahydrofolate cyclo-ligase
MAPKQDEKSRIRKYAKQQRQVLPLNTLSEEILARLQTSPAFQTATWIYGYLPLPGEIDLTPLITTPSTSHRWALPRLGRPDLGELDELHFHTYQHGDPLEKHRFGMPEPSPKAPYPPRPDLILLPGLAYDPQGYRLGYGKGYYDRFLGTFTSQNRPLCVGLIPEALILPSLPIDPWDRPVDVLVSEARILWFKNTPP